MTWRQLFSRLAARRTAASRRIYRSAVYIFAAIDDARLDEPAPLRAIRDRAIGEQQRPTTYEPMYVEDEFDGD